MNIGGWQWPDDPVRRSRADDCRAAAAIVTRCGDPYRPWIGAVRAQMTTPNSIESFIARWQGRAGGQERANDALFLTDSRAAPIWTIRAILPSATA
jgi:hypothetical protein